MKTIYVPSLDGDSDKKVALQIPCEAGQVSDGYHTFDELYEHRCLLFCALLRQILHLELEGVNKIATWKSRKHSDGSAIEGWFLAGVYLPNIGQITYHLPDRMWPLAETIQESESAPVWDGHTSQDVIERLKQWVESKRGL